MATDAVFSEKIADAPEEFDYRPLSTSAVASGVLALLSIMIFVAAQGSFESALMLVPLPVMGLIMGWKSLSTMRANPGQFSGGVVAKLGVALSVVCLVGGLGYGGYVRATEAPPGYERTSFTELRPDEVETRGNHTIPDEIAKLDGQKVFIKGYMRPGTHYSDGGASVSNGIARFLLVRDNQTCCFGDLANVKYFDQMAVACKGRLRTDYKQGLYRVGGTLRVFPENAHDMAHGPAYALEADYIQ
jgi:hypothetical protein